MFRPEMPSLDGLTLTYILGSTVLVVEDALVVGRHICRYKQIDYMFHMPKRTRADDEADKPEASRVAL